MYVHKTRIKKWDFCAGDAILRAAGPFVTIDFCITRTSLLVGGLMTDWQGEAFSYGAPMGEDYVNSRGLLAAYSPTLHAQMLDKLKDVKPG